MKKLLAVLALGLGLILSGCAAGPPQATDNYTGKATILESYRNSRKGGCKLVVKLPDGQQGTVSVGRRTSCDGWTPGRVVSITKGALNK